MLSYCHLVSFEREDDPVRRQETNQMAVFFVFLFNETTYCYGISRCKCIEGRIFEKLE